MIPNKVKHFLRRACSEALSTREQLWKRKCFPNPHCPCCNTAVESVEHMLIICSYEKVVWFGSSLSLRIENGNINRFDLWLFDNLNNTAFSDFNKAMVGMLCWHLCKAMFSFVFEEIPLSPMFVVNQAANGLASF